MIKNKIKKIIFDTMVKIKWSKKFSNFFYNKLYSEQVSELSERGVIKINENFFDFANYISNEYTKKILSNKKTQISIFNKKEYMDQMNANSIYCYLPLGDKKITNFVLNKEITGILNFFFGKRCYLRDDPVLARTHTPSEQVGKGKFHVDRFMQLSVMLLLEDLNEDSTHMEYLVGSHKYITSSLILQKNSEECAKIMRKKKFNVYKLTGKKGDAFLFNSIGIHSAIFVEGTTKTILHLNYTNGHNLFPYEHPSNNKLKFNNDINYETIIRKSNNLIFYNKDSKMGNFKYFKFQ